MAVLTWDAPDQRLYETGVDHGVLYIPDGSGAYTNGVAWNGLTAVTESPSGAEATPQYADNIKYLNLISAEEFGCTIEAFTFPDEFAQFNGEVTPQPGLSLGQQGRKVFGLSYRTRVGDSLVGTDRGYKLHLVYGAQAAPSEKAYSTINDSPEAITFSWEVTTTPVNVTNYKPTAILTINSLNATPAKLTALETLLYGAAGVDPRLPLPDEIITLFAGSVTDVRMTGANAPTYVSGTHIVTLPSVTGVVWRVNGVVKTAGAQPALTVGQTAVVTASPASGYNLTGDTDWVFDY